MGSALKLAAQQHAACTRMHGCRRQSHIATGAVYLLLHSLVQAHKLFRSKIIALALSSTTLGVCSIHWCSALPYCTCAATYVARLFLLYVCMHEHVAHQCCTTQPTIQYFHFVMHLLINISTCMLTYVALDHVIYLQWPHHCRSSDFPYIPRVYKSRWAVLRGRLLPGSNWLHLSTYASLSIAWPDASHSLRFLYNI